MIMVSSGRFGENQNEIDIDPALRSFQSIRGDKHLSTNNWSKHGKISVMRKVLRDTKENVKGDE